MKNRDELIYNLIFSEKNLYDIDISDYTDDVYKYDKFIDDIKKVLKKSKVQVIDEKIDLNTKTVIWSLKVKK